MVVRLLWQECNMKSTVALLEEEEASVMQAKTEVGDFAAIYERYFGPIYSYTFYMLQDPQTADDITAQIFEEALKSVGRYQPKRASLATWLFAIARNTVNKHFRKQKIRQWISLDAIASSAADPNPSVEAIVIKNEKLARLMGLVAGLKERQREVLGLKFGAGLGNQQIAEVTGLSASNVGVILYRSLNTLRELWQEVENDES
jgi:RNA polymerase sigma-70 factor (ECF subfamily)